jgi:hypothetical protein
LLLVAHAREARARRAGGSGEAARTGGARAERSDQGLEWELELGLFNRFTHRQNDVERLLRYNTTTQAFAAASYLTPSVDDTYYSFLASAGVYVKPLSWLGLGLSVDSGELRPVGHLAGEATIPLSLLGGEPAVVQTTGYRKTATASGQPIADEARETAFVRQAFVRLTAPRTGWLTVDLGRASTEIGSGLIYNDYGLGARVTADLELLKDLPLRVSAKVLLPSRSWSGGLHSPLVGLRAEYIFSFSEALGITAAYFRDGDSSFGQLLQPSVSEAAVRMEKSLDPTVHREAFALALETGLPSKANIGWIGVEGNKYVGDLQLAGAFLVEVGHITLDNVFYGLLPSAKVPPMLQGKTIELDTLGFALDLRARYTFSERLALGGFFLFLSGAENPLFAEGGKGRYASFLSVMPYLTRTNLFFSGGMNETFSGRHATTAGINGRGVIAPGLDASWEITDRIAVAGTLAALLAPVAYWQTGSKLYGVEVDLEGSLKLTSFLKLALEYDVLAGGTFFPVRAAIHKVLVGLDLSYER